MSRQLLRADASFRSIMPDPRSASAMVADSASGVIPSLFVAWPVRLTRRRPRFPAFDRHPRPPCSTRRRWSRRDRRKRRNNPTLPAL